MAPKSKKHKNENLIFKIIQFTLNSKIKKNIKIKWIFFFYCSLSWYHWMATEFQLILKGNELERAWKCCCPIHLGHRHCSWKRSNWYWEEIASEDMVDSRKKSATNNTKAASANTKWRYRANNLNFLYFILRWKFLFYYENFILL